MEVRPRAARVAGHRLPRRRSGEGARGVERPGATRAASALAAPRVTTTLGAPGRLTHCRSSARGVVVPPLLAAPARRWAASRRRAGGAIPAWRGCRISGDPQAAHHAVCSGTMLEYECRRPLYLATLREVNRVSWQTKHAASRETQPALRRSDQVSCSTAAAQPGRAYPAVGRQCFSLRGGDRGRMSLHIIAEQQREAKHIHQAAIQKKKWLAGRLTGPT